MRFLFVGFRLLTGLQMGLAWIGILALFLWGAGMLIDAHPIQPVKVTGVVAAASDNYHGDSYEYTEVSLLGDSRTFYLPRDIMKPVLRQHVPAIGEAVAFWINPGINWGNLMTSDVLAASFGDESYARPAHTTLAYDDPNSAVTRQRLVGGGVIGVVALIIGLAALWEWLMDIRPERRKKAYDPGGAPSRMLAPQPEPLLPSP